MEITLTDLFILIGLSQGVIFGTVILSGRLFNHKPNRYLAYAILIISIIGFDEWAGLHNLDDRYYFIDFFGDDVPWILLFYVPVLIYFLKAVGHKFANSKRLWLLAAPFLIFLIINIIIDLDIDFGWINASFFVQNRSIFYDVEFYTAIVYSVVLNVVSFFVIANSKASITDKKWLKKIWVFTFALIFMWAGMVFLPASIYDGSKKMDHLLWMGITIFIYWLIFKGLYQFHLAKNQKAVHRVLQQQESAAHQRSEKLKIDAEGKTVREENKHIHKLKHLMEAEHLYRNPDLSQETVAQKLGISAGHLSQLINSNTQKNFTNFVNTYRVQEVKKLLHDPAFHQFDLVAIGMEAGFKSKSAFYTTFKKETGVTPSQFKKLQDTTSEL